MEESMCFFQAMIIGDHNVVLIETPVEVLLVL